MPNAYVRVGGSWKTISKLHVNVGGVWKEVVNAYVRVGGVWKKFHIGVTPGSFTYSTAGEYNFTVPQFNVMEVEIWGGGGSGSSYSGQNSISGGWGGHSYFNNWEFYVTGGQSPSSASPAPGGTATGGDVNTNGNPGGIGTISGLNPATHVFGGSAPNGGAGGAYNPAYGTANAGQAPGGGGSGAHWYPNYYTAGGGSGAYAKKTYWPGMITPGGTALIEVGYGGSSTPGSPATAPGAPGRVKITWS